MMQILVINGSPKGKGNTYKVIEKLEQAVKKRDNNIEFNYLHLKDINLGMCKGCYACLSVGEDKCPLQDDRHMVEEAMEKADCVIFATPVYVMNVTGLFKNFIDRFAYICHRPKFHGKKAWIICSTGALGTEITARICEMGPMSWGFDVVGHLGVMTSKGLSEEETRIQWEKIDSATEKMADKMVKVLKKKTLPKASLFKLCAFKLQRASFGRADRAQADYKYWKDKGWLEPGCKFFIEAKINPLAQLLSNVIAFFMIKNTSN